MNAKEDPGSRPLRNGRHEQFAQLSAAGISHAESYRQTFGDSKNAAASKNNAYRVSRYPTVRDRVKYLRKVELATHKTGEEEITRVGLLSLMDSVTDALLSAADAAQRAGASPGECQKIRKALTVHAGRVACLTPQKQARLERTPDLDLAGPLARLRRCTCKT